MRVSDSVPRNATHRSRFSRLTIRAVAGPFGGASLAGVQEGRRRPDQIARALFPIRSILQHVQNPVSILDAKKVGSFDRRVVPASDTCPRSIFKRVCGCREKFGFVGIPIAHGWDNRSVIVSPKTEAETEFRDN